MWYRLYVYELITFFRKVLYQCIQRSWPQERSVKCPICGWRGKKFTDYPLGFGRIYYNAECPVCLSHPRHRFVYLYYKKIVQNKGCRRILHCAPDLCLVRYFRSLHKGHYLSIDINRQRAMQKENLESLSFLTSQFDVIVCLCVLEHIIDDNKALLELYRVLKPGGVCILDTPIDYQSAKTLESSSIVSPEDRTIYYWQKDHVRLYGKDFPSRVRKAGFLVHTAFSRLLVTKQDRLIYGLPSLPLYVAVKPAVLQTETKVERHSLFQS